MRIQEENKVEQQRDHQHREQQWDQQLWGKHRVDMRIQEENDEQLIEELDRVRSV